MKLLAFVLLTGAAAAVAQSVDPSRTLLDAALQDEEQGRFDRARLTLRTLATTYSESPLASRARSEVFAIDLFEEGQSKLRQGHTKAAYVTFRTVAQVYPESPLARQAEVVSRVVDPDAAAPAIRMLTYSGPWPVTQQEIRDRFITTEIPLAVGRPYDAREVERARKVLVQLLTDTGHPGLRIKVTTAAAIPDGFAVTFTVEKQ